LKTFEALLLHSQEEAFGGVLAEHIPVMDKSTTMTWILCNEKRLDARYSHNELTFVLNITNINKVKFIHVLCVLEKHAPVYVGCISQAWTAQFSPKQINNLIVSGYEEENTNP